jgi:DNA-binding beta-propeller fold protein YncE
LGLPSTGVAQDQPSKVVPSGSAVAAIPLPGAPDGGLFLDYLAVDRGHHRVWVPAGATGRVDVIDTETRRLQPIEKFPTSEIERRGRKMSIGPSSATIGDGYVYVGNRADSTVCAVNSVSLTREGCVTVPASPDGLAYVATVHEVWVTTPRTKSLYMLDVSKPSAPRLAGNLVLEGEPEGYAVDDAHGVFYTNLEDKDRTLRIDVKTRKVSSTWLPACGEGGPKGLAVEPAGEILVVACPDHVETMDVRQDGKILSKLDTGEGVDNIDYLPASRSLYVAAGRAGTLTVAHLDHRGSLSKTASSPTSRGARNAVADGKGVAYVADGPEGRILVIAPAH